MEARHASADFTDEEREEEVTGDEGFEEDIEEEEEGENEEGEIEEEDEDGPEDSPLLPIFSAAHLGMFSVWIRSQC